MNQKLINNCLEKGYLVSPDLDELDFNVIEKLNKSNYDILVINNDVLSIVKDDNVNVNWDEFEKARYLFDLNIADSYNKFLDLLNHSEEARKSEKLEVNDKINVNILKSYNEISQKIELKSFVDYFKFRYSKLRDILRNRIELQNSVSINRLLNKREKENVAFIGLVNEKKYCKSGNLLLNLEDITGKINVLINKNRDIFNIAKDLVYDEVIGINGVIDKNIVFVNNLFFPDVPLNKELKKCKDDVYAAFISDLHIGSKMFLPDEFFNFLDWLNNNIAAKKIKYLFIIGDLIDGVGVYPEQDKELLIKDVYMQYNECAKLLSKIRRDIKIIICAGNHDALRIAEPQPVLNKYYAKALWDLPNVTMVSNPSLVNIHANDGFSGFDVLLYHGYSFDYYAANIDTIRNGGGYDRSDLIMKFLLQKRHLAPVHSSTLYVPYRDDDPLLIDKIPDFFVSGHIHKIGISDYNNVSMICSSCWQSKTLFQEKVGHNPEPSRVPVVNLNTREIKVINFSK